MDLESAPIDEHDSHLGKPYVSVLMSGVLTSAVTLAGVYCLGRDDFYIMGWYANYVIPAGAIIVGVAAASGYAVASWLTGTRISRGLLLAVLFLQAVAYVTAEYVEYRDAVDTLRQHGMLIGPEPSFAQYYDFKARSFAWKGQGAMNQLPEPLGGWGYVFVLLGAAGFILSGLIAPAVLRSVPYCERCQRYMTTMQLGALPASAPLTKFAKRDQAAQEAHGRKDEQAAANADDAIARLRGAVAEGRADSVKRELLAAGVAKANEELPKRVRVSLIWCKSCEEGRIALVLASGQGKAVQVMKLAEDPVSAAFVGAILAKPTAPGIAAESDAAQDPAGT